MTTIDELIEKLNRRRSTIWGRGGFKPVNPDGPEAASALSSLQEQKRKLEEELAAERAAKQSLASSIAPLSRSGKP